jgi:hypothetical protein
MQLYIEQDFQLRNDNGVLLATNGVVSAITGTTLQYIDGTGSARVLNTSIVPELTNLYFTTARAQAAISGSAPISVASGVVSITQANSTTNGYLSSTDWSTFNAKQAALNGTGFVKIIGTTISYDNSTYYLASNPSNYISLLALSASSPLSYNNATGAFSISQSNATTNGYLSSTDWNTFNNKQNALGYTPVPNTRNLTINGTTYDLSADRTWTIFIPVTSVFGRTGAVVAQSGDYTTTLVTEGTNLYFTNSRAINSTLTGYVSGSGTISSSDSILSAIQKLNGNVGLLTGAIIYQGTWNASTNTPTIISGVGIKGYMYKVSVAGTTTVDGVSQWNVGDQLVFDGTVWDKIDGIANEVLSVFGRVGAVVAASGDYNTSQVTENTNLYYTDARARAAISLTTSGSSGASTYSSSTGILNVPTYTLSGLGGQPQLNGTGFVKASGTTISYDNSTYLTTSAASSTYVPYTGATGNVNLGSYNLSLNAQQFASISAPSYSEGLLWYDSSQKALAYYNDISGNVLHIGQEVQLKVHNNTGSIIAKGAPVYVTSTSSGFSYPNVALAKADTLTTANVIGLANQAIPTGTDGYITLSGLLTGTNTGTFTVGDVLYLSPYSAGQLMNTVPPTGYAVRVGVVSYSNSPNGTIYINQSNAYSTAASIVGTIAILQGGTGATTSAGALTNLGAAASSRLISTTTPLQGGGDLTADRTLSILQSGASQSGYLSSTDWNTFNNKQNALGFLPVGGSGSINYISKFTNSTTISNSGIYEGVTNFVSIGNTNTTYNLDVTGTGRFTNDVLFGNSLTLQGSSFLNSMTHIKQVSVMYPSSGYTTIAGSTTGLTLNTGGSYTLDLSFPTTASYTYTFPSASGTLALTSQLSGVIYGSGVTYQVAWFNATNSIGGSSNLYFDPTNNRLGINQSTPLYSLDVTGTSRITGQLTLGSTITNGTYTYTLPSATGTLALTSQIPSLSATLPISYTSGVISISQATTSTNGYLTSTDWNTFNGKQSALSGTGFVKASGTTISYDNSTYYLASNPSNFISLTGLSATAPLSYNSGTGVFSITQSSGSTNGYLSSSDWTTFNNKQSALTNPVTGTGQSGYVTYWNGTNTVAGSTNHFWDATNNRLGIGLTNPQRSLEIYSATADSHLRLSGAAPSVSMGEAITGSVYQAKFGLATASGQYASGAVAGDFVIISQTGNTIWANSGGERMRLNTNGTFSIGNTNSTYNLDVTGTGRFTSNVGIGYAPNTWFSGYIVLEMGSGALVYPANATNTQLWNNLYIPTSGNVTYKSTGIGGLLSLGGGGNAATFYSAPSGTAGTTATLSALLTIANSGAATFSSSVTAGAGLNATGYTNSSGANYWEIGTDANGYYMNALNRSIGNYNKPAYIDAQKLILNSGSGGSVGIGTTSPSSLLTLSSNSTDLSVISTGSSVSSRLILKTNTSEFRLGSSTDNACWIYDATGAAYRFYINSSGNVGIGTTSPNYKLSVQGPNGGTAISWTDAANNTGYLSIRSAAAAIGADNNLVFETAATERMRITSAGTTQPGTDNAYSLGASGIRWSAVWAANGTIQTSDEREKQDIIDSDLGLDFVSKLRPVSFKWKVGQNIVTSEVVKDEHGNPILDENGKEKTESVITPRQGKRVHYGLIAQEVEALLDGKDFGGFIHDEETDTKGLRYDQFVPLLIKSIQELQAKIVTLESKLN